VSICLIHARLALPLGNHTPAVEAALLPELEGGPLDRAKAAISTDGGELCIDFEAQDLVALRAAVNTWMRLILVASRILKYEQK